MKQYWLKKGLMFGAFILIGGALMSVAVMLLWNALLPSILGASVITFWQAAGLLLLARILFGGGMGRGRRWGGGHRGGREKWKKRWESMSPEQRAKMREFWGDRCGNHRGRHFPGHHDNPDNTPENQSEAG